ncbi:hypothetical protein GW17_00003907 [Ensete ventricosum]|nr:hypothetical protein GW17_00003907 [Ensete ventricosum]
MGGTYQSARLPVRGLPATGRYCQKSTIDGRFSGEIGLIEGEKGKKKKRKRRKNKRRRIKPSTVLARTPSPPASRPRAVTGRTPSPARCRWASTLAHFFSHARRRNVSRREEKDRGDMIDKMDNKSCTYHDDLEEIGFLGGKRRTHPWRRSKETLEGHEAEERGEDREGRIESKGFLLSSILSVVGVRSSGAEVSNAATLPLPRFLRKHQLTECTERTIVYMGMASGPHLRFEHRAPIILRSTDPGVAG